MPSIRVTGKHGFNVRFSPLYPQCLACAASENYGMRGRGFLLIFENDNSDHLKQRRCSSWASGLLDVTWLKANEYLLLTSSCDGSLQLWNLFESHSLNPVQVFREHSLDVSSVDSNQNYIASGSWDSKIKVWDINKPSSIITLQSGEGIVHSVKWSTSFPNLLLSVSNVSHFALWDINQPKSSVHTVEPKNAEPLDCDWSHTNAYELVVCDNLGVVRVWDIRHFRFPRFVMEGPHRPLARVRWSPHLQNVISTTSYNLSTSIWDISRSELIETVRHHSAFITGLDFNRNVPGQIADCGFDSLIHVFTPWTLQELNCKTFLKNKL